MRSTTNTESLSLSQAITFNVPAQSTYVTTGTVAVGQVSATTVTQDALYYYKQNLPGSVPQDDGTYLLTAPIVTVIHGELGSKAELEVKSTPIGGGGHRRW